VRVEHAQQRVGEFRKFVIQPLLYPRGQEGNAFEQTLDMGVVYRAARQPQASRYLRMRIGKLPGQVAQRIELPVVL
jgi:hypothetical protein